jgi:hypothetical protein
MDKNVMREHPIQQEIDSITITHTACSGEQYTVGVGGVTRIEAAIKSGAMSYVPYVRVWRGDEVFAEFCQHNIIGVYYSSKMKSKFPLPLIDWVKERRDNCIAAARAGADRDGWLEDASYFQMILDALGAAEARDEFRRSE